jgi:hypothetical protein
MPPHPNFLLVNCVKAMAALPLLDCCRANNPNSRSCHCLLLARPWNAYGLPHLTRCDDSCYAAFVLIASTRLWFRHCVNTAQYALQLAGPQPTGPRHCLLHVVYRALRQGSLGECGAERPPLSTQFRFVEPLLKSRCQMGAPVSSTTGWILRPGLTL